MIHRIRFTVAVTATAIISLVPRVVTAQQWSVCGLKSDVDTLAQCTTIAVPLDHKHTGGGTLDLAIKRVPARGPERSQLWFLDGGPGDAGRASLGRVADLFSPVEGLALYTFDHRGVGGSAPLRCPEQQKKSSPDGWDVVAKEWPACVAHLQATRPDLPYINVTQASRDLGLIVERFRSPGTRVTVWGVSYGSFLIWQYLHLFPDQPDAVIVDGIVPPDWSFAEFDRGMDETGRRWIQRCAQDADCRAHLGDDPVAYVEQSVRSLERGPCRALGLTPDLYRIAQGSQLQKGDPLRSLIPVIAYRVRRCGWRDRDAFVAWFQTVFNSGMVAEDPGRHDPVAQRHIAMSDLWRASDPPADSLARENERQILSTGVSASFARTYPGWPVSREAHDTTLPAYGRPLLMLHGSMDPTMPADRLATIRQRYRGPGQTFVLVPDAGHVTVNAGECPRSIYRAFLEHPDKAPDTSCIGSMPAPPVVASRETARRFLGTRDAWGDRRPSLGVTALIGAGWIAATTAWVIGLQ